MNSLKTEGELALADIKNSIALMSVSEAMVLGLHRKIAKLTEDIALLTDTTLVQVSLAKDIDSGKFLYTNKETREAATQQVLKKNPKFSELRQELEKATFEKDEQKNILESLYRKFDSDKLRLKFIVACIEAKA